jgi:hypothetical protein
MSEEREDWSEEEVNPAGRARKLQSETPCTATSAYTGKPCKFASKPGKLYCGQHLKVVMTFNSRLRTEAVNIIYRTCKGDETDTRCGFLSTIWVGEVSSIVTLQIVEEGLNMKNLCLRCKDVVWEDERKLNPREIEAYSLKVDI